MKKQKVLIVDDDQDFIFQQKTGLEKLDYEVITADGRKEALEKIKKFQPDCAIVDLMMEETDSGLVLVHELKNIFPKMPVILVTAVTSETGIDFQAINDNEKKWTKADVLLNKPIRFEQLRKELQGIIA